VREGDTFVEAHVSPFGRAGQAKIDFGKDPIGKDPQQKRS